MCWSNGDNPKSKHVLKNNMNNFHVHQKLIWILEGHLPFQYIIGHFDWNPNFWSTSQGPNFLNFYDFEVRLNELEILLCLIQMLCWTKFQNLKGNTCDNARDYRSFWVKCIKRQNSPTSSAHNFFIKTPNDANFKSILIVLKIYTTLMLEVFPFGVCIIKLEGLEVGSFWQISQRHILCIELHGLFS